jgi:hypothetical protein
VPVRIVASRWATERRINGPEAVHRGPDGSRHAQSSPFGCGGGLPIATTEADGSADFAGQEVQLLAGPIGSLGVVPRLRLRDVLAELVDPSPVLGLGLVIENRSIIAEPSRCQVIIVG